MLFPYRCGSLCLINHLEKNHEDQIREDKLRLNIGNTNIKEESSENPDVQEVITIINSNPKTAPRGRKIFISDIKSLLNNSNNENEDLKPNLKPIMYDASNFGSSDLDSPPIHHHDPNLTKILKIEETDKTQINLDCCDLDEDINAPIQIVKKMRKRSRRNTNHELFNQEDSKENLSVQISDDSPRSKSRKLQIGKCPKSLTAPKVEPNSGKMNSKMPIGKKYASVRSKY